MILYSGDANGQTANYPHLKPEDLGTQSLTGSKSEVGMGFGSFLEVILDAVRFWCSGYQPN